VAGTVGVGAGWWLALASISFTAKPLSQSVVWLLVAALSGLFTLTALVLCIVKLVKGGRRVVAAIGLAVALIGPPSATNLGFNAGLNDLYDHATAAAGYVVESVTELLGVTEMPAWLAGLLELLQ
jgi:hypothetical protein